MANNYFSFKEFTIQQSDCNMKVCTDSCLFGAWVAQDIYVNKKDEINVLDVGTGTGLLSLMISQLNNSLNINAVEIHSPSALQAEQNVLNSPWSRKIEIIEVGILDFKPTHKYDIIITNPPFFAGSLKSPNENQNIPKHESDLTLKNLIYYIKENLINDGFAYILLPYNRTDEAEKIISSAGFFINKKINVKQKEGADYFRIMLKISKAFFQKMSIDEINIKNSENNYSIEFTNLLKPFYLFL